MPHTNPNPDPAPVSVAANNSLKDLQTIARQNEEQFGQLYQLGNAGGKTILTFDFRYQVPDSSELVLKQTINGTAPLVSGRELVCQGDCFVAGQLLNIAAYR